MDPPPPINPRTTPTMTPEATAGNSALMPVSLRWLTASGVAYLVPDGVQNAERERQSEPQYPTEIPHILASLPIQ